MTEQGTNSPRFNKHVLKSKSDHSLIEKIIENSFEKSDKRIKLRSDIPLTKLTGDKDIFCWLCHRGGSGTVTCNICPRIYHMACARMDSVPETWYCFECNAGMIAGSLEGRSEAMSSLSQDKFNQLLKFVMEKIHSLDNSYHFNYPSDLYKYHDFRDFIINPMDLIIIEENINNSKYNSTESFLADLRWLLHNSYICNLVYSSELITYSNAIMNIAMQQAEEIENCPSCYYNYHTIDEDMWFIETCEKPHLLVWAKLRGYPYWPAKVMRILDNLVDVSFFGDHSRAWLPPENCYLFSQSPPSLIKKGEEHGYDKSIKQCLTHIKKLKDKFGDFCYSAMRMKYLPSDHTQQLSDMLPALKMKSIPEEISSKKTKIKDDDKICRNRSLHGAKGKGLPLKIAKLDTFYSEKMIENTHEKFKSSSDLSLTRIIGNKDIFCWLCHLGGPDLMNCNFCPRTFHKECAKIYYAPENWLCFECNARMIAGSKEGCSEAIKSLSLNEFNQLLKIVMVRIYSLEGSDKFRQLEDLLKNPNYKDFIINPMDLSLIEKNINNSKYDSTESFLADLKWIIHNAQICNIVCSHKLITFSNAIMKIALQQAEEIETCPSCYYHYHTMDEDTWFVKPCKIPHLLVWAKVKGFPFWPAKVMRVMDGLVDVGFFGDHSRAWLSPEACYLFSKSSPCVFSKANLRGYTKSINEILLHIEKLKSKFKEFHFPAFKIEYSPSEHMQQLSDMLPSYKNSIMKPDNQSFSNFNNNTTIFSQRNEDPREKDGAESQKSYKNTFDVENDRGNFSFSRIHQLSNYNVTKLNISKHSVSELKDKFPGLSENILKLNKAAPRINYSMIDNYEGLSKNINVPNNALQFKSKFENIFELNRGTEDNFTMTKSVEKESNHLSCFTKTTNSEERISTDKSLCLIRVKSCAELLSSEALERHKLISLGCHH